MTGEQLNKLLKDRGVKQRFISQRLGVSDAMVSHWLSGNRIISEKRAENLKTLFKVK